MVSRTSNVHNIQCTKLTGLTLFMLSFVIRVSVRRNGSAHDELCCVSVDMFVTGSNFFRWHPSATKYLELLLLL